MSRAAVFTVMTVKCMERSPAEAFRRFEEKYCLRNVGEIQADYTALQTVHPRRYYSSEYEWFLNDEESELPRK
jgi:hypothetical protein